MKFKVGDLVLLNMEEPFCRKLSYMGIGPHIVTRLLDGGFIAGPEDHWFQSHELTEFKQLPAQELL